jgi:hypothetical protein
MTAGAFDDVAIIVRECGERTADACVDLLRELAPGRQIHRVTARPFSAALRESLQLGIRLQQPWTLCIDADVLVLPALAEFMAEARHLHPDTFEVQALIYDKLLPSWRPAGNHLYRTELLPLALPLIPRDNALRPETATIQAMAVKGFGFHQSRHHIGLHDFEQSPADIYAKAYLHAHKHAHLQHIFLPLWQSQAVSDVDYATALRAASDAAEDDLAPHVCRDFTDSCLARSDVQFAAKPPLARLTLADAARLLPSDGAPAAGHDDYLALQQAIDAAVFPPPPPAPGKMGKLVAALKLCLRIWRWMLPLLATARRDKDAR